VIVSLHVATGAAVGALAGNRFRALALGPLVHLVGDMIPHHDIASRRFEICSGVALLGLVAAARGPFDRAVFGAVAASTPDLEHVIRFPRPGGRKLFPSHRVRGWHRTGGLPTWFQLLAAGLIAGTLLGSRKETPCR
jgi:hypothetical protein